MKALMRHMWVAVFLPCCIFGIDSQSLKLLKEQAISFNQSIQVTIQINYRKADVVLTSAKDLDSIYFSKESILDQSSSSLNTSSPSIFDQRKDTIPDTITISLFECIDTVFITLVPKIGSTAQLNLLVKSNGEGNTIGNINIDIEPCKANSEVSNPTSYLTCGNMTAIGCRSRHTKDCKEVVCHAPSKTVIML